MLNLDSRSKSKLLWIGTLLVPAIAVQVVRFMVGGGPAAASAATQPASAPPSPIAARPDVTKSLTPAQAKAVEWLGSRKLVLGVRSPMDHPDVMVETPASQIPTQVASNPTPAPAPTPAAPRPPSSMTVTALITGGTVDSSIVSINHKLFRVGDEIVPRWRIVALDSRSRTVTIAGPEGQSITLSLTIPEN